jgi:hypothetical protein
MTKDQHQKAISAINEAMAVLEDAGLMQAFDNADAKAYALGLHQALKAAKNLAAASK